MRIAIYKERMSEREMEQQRIMDSYFSGEWYKLELNQAYKVKDNDCSGEIMVEGRPLCAVNSVNGNRHFKIVEKRFARVKGV